MATNYSTGTVEAVNGSSTLVLTGGAWSNLVARAGDMLVIGGAHVGFIDSITDTTHLELVLPFEGASASGLSYTISHSSFEWGLHKTQNELVAEYIQGLENPVRIETGNGVPSAGLGDDQALYMDNDNGDWYLKDSGAWQFQRNMLGPQGIQGPAATIEVNSVTTIAAGEPATVANAGTPNAASFDFELPAGFNGADGANGLLSAAQFVKTDDYSVVAADKGKTLIADKATAIGFDFVAAATLTNDYMVLVKNEGVGILTLTPNGAELVDGLASVDLEQGSSLAVYSDGISLRTLLAGGGGSTLKAENNLSDVNNAGAALANLGGFPSGGGTVTGVLNVRAGYPTAKITRDYDVVGGPAGAGLDFQCLFNGVETPGSRIIGVLEDGDDGYMSLLTRQSGGLTEVQRLQSDGDAKFFGRVLKPNQPSFLAIATAPSLDGVAGSFKPQNVKHNVGLVYDPVTGRMTATATGVWVFGGTLLSVSGDTVNAFIQHNGVPVVSNENTRVAAGYASASAIVPISMIEGDYLTLNTSGNFYNNTYDWLYGWMIG